VQSRHGVVMLSGTAASAQIRTTADICAASVPIVRGLINALHAPGLSITAGDLRALQPKIGQEVYAPEVRIGRVAHVIIHPSHRRVTAVVVDRQLRDPSPTTRHLGPDQLTSHECHIAIPINAVAEVTDSAVLLDISASEVAGCRQFDPAAFAPPPAGWQPPYPYHTADVLIECGAEAPDRISGRPEDRLQRGDAAGVHDTLSWERLSRGMPILFRDHSVGTIEHIWVDSYHDGMGEIMVRLAVAPHTEISMPLDRVHIVEDMGAFANVDAAELELLPAASLS
jgi:hypothetical protein